MDRSILLPVHPYFAKLIFTEQKFVEIRRRMPKLKCPFRVLVYCTKPVRLCRRGGWKWYWDEPFLVTDDRLHQEIVLYEDLRRGKKRFPADEGFIMEKVGGKVIGEFMCREIEEHNIMYDDTDVTKTISENAAITPGELLEMSDGGDCLVWRIREPKLYECGIPPEQYGIMSVPRHFVYTRI